MMTLSKLLQTKLYLVAIILISATFVFATPKPVTETADIGNGVGEYRFELHKIGTAEFESWDGVSAEILIFKKGNSEVLQRLPVDIFIDSPSFYMMDVNGDGYQDLLLYDDHAGYGAGPSTSADVFMYIPKLQHFVRSKTLSGRGNIEASKNKGCVIINYKISAQDNTDEEWCFDISTGKWKMANSSTGGPECFKDIIMSPIPFDIYLADGGTSIQPARSIFGYQDNIQISMEIEGSLYSMASLCDGNIVAIWENRSCGRCQSFLYGIIFNRQLKPVIKDFRITEKDEVQWEADVASLADGRFVVTWKTLYHVKKGKDQITVRGKIFQSSGLPASSVFNVSTSLGQNNGASVQGLPDGGFVVLWHLFSKGIRMRIFNQNGSPRTDEIPVRDDIRNDVGYLVPYAVVTRQGDIDIFLKYDYELLSKFLFEYAMKYNRNGKAIGKVLTVDQAPSLEGYQEAVERVVRESAVRLEANLRGILKDDAAGLRTCTQTGGHGTEANKMWKFTRDPRMKSFFESYCKQASGICGAATTFNRLEDRECELGSNNVVNILENKRYVKPKKMVYDSDEDVIVPKYVKDTWKSVIIEVELKQSRTKKRYIIPINSKFIVPGTDLIIHVGDFLPTLMATEHSDTKAGETRKTPRLSFTTTSNEPRNPAVYLRIYVDGKLSFRGFLFNKLLGGHIFAHDRYGVNLIEGLKQ
ncbi:MAG: hypothetical protein A2Y65_09160 [Deltaproteobacteria bacterium RBG_13_52_11]|nr:MAG: hypothetical protein A2Y65_09160 [Deltaproteobacteria bacterium RBG_13_52_11]